MHQANNEIQVLKDPEWITIIQACETVDISRRTMYNWMSKNLIVTRKTAGGHTRILKSSLWRDQ